MEKDETKNSIGHNDEATTIAGPAPYEEELKDYSKSGEDEPIDNLPHTHPEPSPTQNP